MSPQTAVRCCACGAGHPRPFFEVSEIPVLVCALWPDAESARACPRGDLLLTHCETCGAIENQAFDPQRVVYTDQYENSLHFSEFFQGYVRDLATGIVDRFKPRGRTVVEIGSGDGQFLELLCELGECSGVGFDPSYDPAAPDELQGGRVRFVREYFGPEQAKLGADLVVCRQVLEHVPDPGAMLRSVREGLAADASVVFEVPNARYTLETPSLWDVIYEHVTYWSAGSLARLFAASGYDVTGSELTYANQFVAVDARPAAGARGRILGEVDSLEDLNKAVQHFASLWRERIATWRAELERRQAAGQRVVLWGTGARGVNFLNIADPTGVIETVIDINPRKHGMHAPGTGQRICAPEALLESPPDLVIVMNPNYLAEITTSLHELELHPEVVGA
jgi:SAM-dependent methyltransferase